MRFSHPLSTILLLIPSISANFDLGYTSDSDLTSFVTRPEIKAPILRVRTPLPPLQSASSPLSPKEYIFLSPAPSTPIPRSFSFSKSRYYHACQTGPHIYSTENGGELVWSGACEFGNLPTADLKPVRFSDDDDDDGHAGESYLSLILPPNPSVAAREYNATTLSTILLNQSYARVSGMKPPAKAMSDFDLPSVSISTTVKADAKEGRRRRGKMLMIMKRPVYTDLPPTGGNDAGKERGAGWVWDMGFQERDLFTGEVGFEWWALGKIGLEESREERIGIRGPPPGRAWDAFAITAVDWAEDGGYVVCARNADMILKVGRNGEVVWRAGGEKADFGKEFGFRAQSDVKVVRRDEATFETRDGWEYVVVFNNNVEEYTIEPGASSVMVVGLHGEGKIAELVTEIRRPDGRLTRTGGNAEFLDNGNVFIAWGDDGHVSEHLLSGTLIMEGKFGSDRFMTTRGHKGGFIAKPDDAPTLICRVFGITKQTATTVCWVSWNGATEVEQWRLRADDGNVLVTVGKKGFETMVQLEGHRERMYVEALDDEVYVLGRSKVVEVGA